MKKILLLLLFPGVSSASSITDTYHTSKLNKSNTLSGVYTARESTKEEVGVEINLDYSTSNLKSFDYTGLEVENKSVDVDLGVSWETPRHWTMGLQGATGTQSTDNIESKAVSAFVGKKFVFGESEFSASEKSTVQTSKKITQKKASQKPEDEEESKDGEDVADEEKEFLPSFSLKYEFTNNGMSQKVAGKRTVNLLTLGQTSSEITVVISPLEFVDLTVSAKRYSYSRDVDAYIALLETPAATRRFGGTFGSSLTSLSASESEINLSFHLTDHWDLDLTNGNTKDAPAPQYTSDDKSVSIAYSADGGWGISIGTGQTYDSSSDSRDSYQTLSAHYNF